MEWQPIETAPKDKSLILIGVSNGMGYWEMEMVIARRHEFEGDGWGVTRDICGYTHWHPVAKPPE